ncbi:MAG: GNAT family N-acetyltransferase [Rhodospirillales bacterium]
MTQNLVVGEATNRGVATGPVERTRFTEEYGLPTYRLVSANLADETEGGAVPHGFTIETGFDPAQRVTAAGLYWEAFSGKLGHLMRPEPKALRFLDLALDPTFALSAVTPDGKLLGIAGYKTQTGAFVGGGLRELAACYGWPGTLWRAPLLALLERKVEDGLLLMDGICVAPEARGRGVGSALLDAVIGQAERYDLRGVRLDVIDKNPRARALYERKGFHATRTEEIGPLSFIFGFKTATTMIRSVSEAPDAAG